MVVVFSRPHVSHIIHSRFRLDRVVWTILIAMGSKLSSASDSETLAESAATAMSGSVGGLNRHHRHHHYHRHHMSASSGARSRARSFGGVTHREAGATSSGALDIDLSSLLDLDRPRSRSVIAAGSVPVRVFSFGKIILSFVDGTTILLSAALLISLVLSRIRTVYGTKQATEYPITPVTHISDCEGVSGVDSAL